MRTPEGDAPYSLVPWVVIDRGEMRIVLCAFRILFDFEDKVHRAGDGMVKDPEQTPGPTPHEEERKGRKNDENDPYQEPHEMTLVRFVGGVEQRRIKVQSERNESKDEDEDNCGSDQKGVATESSDIPIFHLMTLSEI